MPREGGHSRPRILRRRGQNELLEECGRGVSATVWRARVVEPSSPHLGEDVAVKLMDLESASLSLDEIVREAATMRAHSHPNVLPLLT